MLILETPVPWVKFIPVIVNTEDPVFNADAGNTPVTVGACADAGAQTCHLLITVQWKLSKYLSGPEVNDWLSMEK